MHYNELQFSPTETPGNFYSLCVVEPRDPSVLGDTERAVCLFAIAGGSIYALRFADLDNRRRRSPLVVSKYALLDLKGYHGKRKLFGELTPDEVVNINVEICAIDSLQSNARTYVGITYLKTTRKMDAIDSTAYGFALFELVRMTETRKFDLRFLFKKNLAYMPSLLTHTKIYRLHECKLVDVFVSFCFEKSRHDKGCVCEVISLNQHEKENLREQYFPETETTQPKNVFQGQFLLANSDTVRISAWGTDTGCLRVTAVCLHSLDILRSCTLEYDVSILNCRFLTPKPLASGGAAELTWDNPALGLIVSAVTEPVVLFTNLFVGQPSPVEFEGTRELDCPAFICALDVDEDGEEEVVVASFCQRVRLYKRSPPPRQDFCMIFERMFNAPVQCVAHADVTGDGVRELLVLTVTGLHVLQRSRSQIEEKLMARLAELGLDGGSEKDAAVEASAAAADAV